MKVTIRKHFNYQTPFSEASNSDELAHIMSLKYPKTCGNLETGAACFAEMVAEVREYEAWKVIGFDSFEAFCKAKLNRTIEEVEEIVEGVRILGGNPTEADAKKASKAARIRQLAADRPEMTRAEIAREVGTDRGQVSKVLSKTCNTKKTAPKITIRLTRDPSLTARNILAKMGKDYARTLAGELLK